MTPCEFVLDPYGTTRYVFLILGFTVGFFLSMYLFFQIRKDPKIISFETDLGIRRFHRIGEFYYTEEFLKKNLEIKKTTGEI